MPKRPLLDRRGSAEDGFSLIELLVTLVIVGSAFVILVGGTLTGVIASNTHREKADGEIVLRRFIDEVKAAGPYKECPPAPTDYIPDPGPPNEWRDGFDLQIEACESIGVPTDGLQKLRLAVEPIVDSGDGPDNNARLEIEIVKRDES